MAISKKKKKVKKKLILESEENTFRIWFSHAARILRTELGLTQKEFASKLGVKNIVTISRLETSLIEYIRLDVLCRLTRIAYDVGRDGHWLLSGDTASKEKQEKVEVVIEELVSEKTYEMFGEVLAERDKEAHELQLDLIKKISALTQKIDNLEKRKGTVPQEEIGGSIEVASDELPKKWKGLFVPVLGRIAAGEGVDTTQAEETPPGFALSFIEYKDAPPSAFAVRVLGDSMEPDFMSGDIVIVDPDQNVESGLACVILEVDGFREPRLKDLRRKANGLYLVSRNRNYKPLKIKGKDIEALKIIDHLP